VAVWQTYSADFCMTDDRLSWPILLADEILSATFRYIKKTRRQLWQYVSISNLTPLPFCIIFISAKSHYEWTWLICEVSIPVDWHCGRLIVSDIFEVASELEDGAERRQKNTTTTRRNWPTLSFVWHQLYTRPTIITAEMFKTKTSVPSQSKASEVLRTVWDEVFIVAHSQLGRETYSPNITAKCNQQ